MKWRRIGSFILSLFLISSCAFPFFFLTSCSNKKKDNNFFSLSQYTQGDNLNGMRIIFDPSIFTSINDKRWLEILPNNSGFFIGPKNIQDINIETKNLKDLSKTTGLWFYKGNLNLTFLQRNTIFSNLNPENNIIFFNRFSPFDEDTSETNYLNEANLSMDPMIPLGFDPNGHYTNTYLFNSRIYEVDSSFNFKEMSEEKIKKIGSLLYFKRDFEDKEFNNKVDKSLLFPTNINPKGLEFDFSFEENDISTWCANNNDWKGIYLFVGWDKLNKSKKFASYSPSDFKNTLFFNFTESTIDVEPANYTSNIFLVYINPLLLGDEDFSLINKVSYSDLKQDGFSLSPIVFDNNMDFETKNGVLFNQIVDFYAEDLPEWISISKNGVLSLNPEYKETTLTNAKVKITVAINKDNAFGRFTNLKPFTYEIFFYNDTNNDEQTHFFSFNKTNESKKNWNEIIFDSSKENITIPNVLLQIKNNVVSEANTLPSKCKIESDDEENYGITLNSEWSYCSGTPNKIFCVDSEKLPTDSKTHYVTVIFQDNNENEIGRIRLAIYEKNEISKEKICPYSIFFINEEGECDKIAPWIFENKKEKVKFESKKTTLRKYNFLKVSNYKSSDFVFKQKYDYNNSNKFFIFFISSLIDKILFL